MQMLMNEIRGPNSQRGRDKRPQPGEFVTAARRGARRDACVQEDSVGLEHVAFTEAAALDWE